jgi:transcriptional regulator with XRE-family HTH domain
MSMPRKPNYPKNPTKLAEFVIARLDQSGKTATDLAEETGISQSHLSEILHGKHPATAKILNKLADHINVPRLALYELVGWVEFDDEKTILFLVDKLSEYDTGISDLKKTIDNVTG